MDCHQNATPRRGIWHNTKRIYEFMTMLNVEIFIFLVWMSFNIKKIPTDQLIQDKICLQKYNLTQEYCTQLPKMTNEQDYLQKKTLILEDMTHFTLYNTMVYTIPAVMASLLIGSWTDKYQGAKKTLMCAGALANLIEMLLYILNVYFFDESPFYILIALIPPCSMGGLLAVFTALWSYIASTTPPKLRAMRMMVAEIAFFAAAPIGTYIGGQVLNTSPIFKHGQLHNYTMVYIIGAVANTLALVWVLLRVNEKRDIKEFRKRFHIREELDMQSKGRVVCDKQQQFNDNKHINPVKLLFNIQNIKDMIHTCCKPRTNYVRLQIWLLFLSMMFYLMAHMGTNIFLYPFVQKVYHWDSETYSDVNAIGNVIQAIATILLAPILIKIIRVKDTTLALVGLGAYFSQNIIRGLVLNPTGFYISLLTGAIGAITSVGIRTHFSKIVEPNELGKVFSLMSAIDSLAPLISSAIFSNLFNATMDTMPGISFLLLCGFMLIPMLIIFWIDLFTVLPDIRQTKEINIEVIPDVISDVTKL